MSCSNRSPGNGTPKQDNPFHSISFNKVIAYDYDGERGESIINSKGNLSKKIFKEVVLSQTQIDSLTQMLSSDDTYGGMQMDCFIPHLGIVFYRNDSVMAHVSICLLCNFLKSTVKLPSGGFSSYGRQRITNLCKELDFSLTYQKR